MNFLKGLFIKNQFQDISIYLILSVFGLITKHGFFIIESLIVILKIPILSLQKKRQIKNIVLTLSSIIFTQCQLPIRI